jgi:hypothetical protein
MRADPYNVRFLPTMRLAFVPNQHGLRLNDAEIRVLTPDANAKEVPKATQTIATESLLMPPFIVQMN